MMAGEVFRLLAKGIHPETGEVLAPGSVVHSPEAVRLLFLLAEEFSFTPFSSVKRREKTRLTADERRQKNREKGRPANAFLPWSEEQQQQLIEQFKRGCTVSELAEFCERSPRSVAMQLERLTLITSSEAAAFN